MKAAAIPPKLVIIRHSYSGSRDCFTMLERTPPRSLTPLGMHLRLVLVWLASLIVTALAAAWLLDRQLNELAEQHNASLKGVLIQQTQLAAIPLLIGDDRIGLNVLINDLHQHPLVDAAALYRDDQLLARAGSQTQGFDQELKIKVNQQTVGSLRVRWQQPDWPLSLSNLLNYHGYEYSLLLALSLIPMIWLARYMQRPLSDLTEASRQLRYGERFYPLDEHRKDEWGYINFCFNRLHAESLNEVPVLVEQVTLPQQELDLRPLENSQSQNNQDPLAELTLKPRSLNPSRKEPLPFTPLEAAIENAKAQPPASTAAIPTSNKDELDFGAPLFAASPARVSSQPAEPQPIAKQPQPVAVQPLAAQRAEPQLGSLTFDLPSDSKAQPDLGAPLFSEPQPAAKQVQLSTQHEPPRQAPDFASELVQALATPPSKPASPEPSSVSQSDDRVFVLFITHQQSTGYASTAEREEALARYHDFINQACRLYGGILEFDVDDNLLVVFDSPEQDGSHGLNSLCAATLFLGLYKGYNQTRIKQLKPILNLQLALHTGPLKQLHQVSNYCSELASKVSSNQLIISRAVYDTDLLREKLLDDRYIRPAGEGIYLVERLQDKPQRLLERQVVHFSSKHLQQEKAQS